MAKSHNENRTMSEQQARKVVEALNGGQTISNVCASGPSYIINNTALLIFRRKHPKYDRLVVRLSSANAKVHHAEAAARRFQIVRAPTIAAHGTDIFMLIRSAVPAGAIRCNSCRAIRFWSPRGHLGLAGAQNSQSPICRGRSAI
jgi:hypothetical protein